MTALVVRGDAAHLPLPDASVDLVITSPPYFALRSYTDGGAHYSGQIGSEPTPAEYIAALIACTREWVRVLKPSGSIWVNLGDKYDSGTATGRVNPGTVKDGQGQGWNQGTPRWTGGRPKSLILLPERYRIACVDELGLIARAVVIWSKPNGLPESVTDRVRRSHEDWVHLTVRPRYYAAVDRIRQPHDPASQEHVRRYTGRDYGKTNGARRDLGASNFVGSLLGALPGSVRTVATQPLTVPAHLGIDHFAAFPMDWPRWIIGGWSPEHVCTVCGEGRRPVTEKAALSVRSRGYTSESWNAGSLRMRGGNAEAGRRPQAEHVMTAISGERCACLDTSAPTTPGVVLDPFGGTGTTSLVASVMGRTGISVDMSWDYCRLAAWRTTDPGQVAAAMQVEKPVRQVDAQLDLFGEAL